MRRTPWIINLIAPALIGVRALAGDGVPSPTEVILLQRCTIEYERSTRVGPTRILQWAFSKIAWSGRVTG